MVSVSFREIAEYITHIYQSNSCRNLPRISLSQSSLAVWKSAREVWHPQRSSSQYFALALVFLLASGGKQRQQTLDAQLEVYDAQLWTKVLPWPQSGGRVEPTNTPTASPICPRLSEQFCMMPAKSGTHFRSKENAYRIYSTRWPGQPLRCFLLIEIPVDDGPCLELRAPKVFGEQQGAFLDIAGNRSLVQTPGSRAAGLADIDMHNAQSLFGRPVQERDYLTFSLDTYNGPKFAVDVIFENDRIQKYRVRGVDILRPVWQLAADKSVVPLHLVCGSGRFLYPVGLHEFPVVKTSPHFLPSIHIPEDPP